MGMDLHRVKDGVYFRWANNSWYAILELAQEFGWEPAGTVPSKLMLNVHGEEAAKRWTGSYTHNEYQIITDEDACNMADALERALPVVPDTDDKGTLTVVPKLFTIDFEKLAELADDEVKKLKKEEALLPTYTQEEWDSLTNAEKFAGRKGKLENFIAYLRVGGCEIH